MHVNWLQKAVLETTDLSGGGDGGLLSPDQTREFLRIAITESTFLRDLNIHDSRSPLFEVPRISFAERILRAGVESTRLDAADRIKPTTGLVTLTTQLFKGEVPISDETFEDNIEKEALADTVATMLAEAIGRDLEEIVIKSDTARDPGGADPSGDAVLDKIEGAIKQLQGGLPTEQKIDASAISSYDELFGSLLAALPARYRRNYKQLRFYVPTRHKDGYGQELGGRGTILGDTALIEGMPEGRLAYRGIPVAEVPLMSGTGTINGSNIDYSKFIMLIHPMNLFLGFHRRIRMERWRDPREGVTSFLPSLRMDAKFGDPAFGVLGYDIAL